MMFFIVPRRNFFAWIAVFGSLIAVVAILYFQLQKRLLWFRQSFTEALSLVLIKMKSGRSFRQSFAEVITESDQVMSVKFSEIASAVAFSQQSQRLPADDFVAQVVREFVIADRQPHLALRRLIVLRDRLRIEDDFRRRSGQVLSRIRAQSLVMSGLYLAVFSFMTWKFGWKSNSEIMLTSFFIFAAGAVWIWRGGKKLKWKV
jgi:hypothetical protein